jgi:DNA-binding response OmpR family regulator
MKHILSVSYDDRLLLAQRRLLEQQGYHVTSVLGFKEAMAVCADQDFDLFILGASIPDADNIKLIEAFRSKCAAPVLSIWKHEQQSEHGANYLVFSDNSDELLRSVAAILSRAEPQATTESPLH